MERITKGDLQLGDWVMVRMEDGYMPNAEVKRISEDGVRVKANNCSYFASWDDLYAIPITEDFVEANGLDAAINTNGENIRVMGDMVAVWQDYSQKCRMRGIKNVHQVQHIMKLFGINQKIII